MLRYCVCVYVGVYVCVCVVYVMYVHVHTFLCKYAHLWKTKFDIWCLFSDASLTYSRALWSYANWPESPRCPSVCALSCWDYRCRMPCLAFYINTCNPNSGHPAVQHMSLDLILKIGIECLFSIYWHSLGDCIDCTIGSEWLPSGITLPK